MHWGARVTYRVQISLLSHSSGMLMVKCVPLLCTFSTVPVAVVLDFPPLRLLPAGISYVVQRRHYYEGTSLK